MSFCIVFFFQAEDGIRDLVRSRGLGDVYKRQIIGSGPGSLVEVFNGMPLGFVDTVLSSLLSSEPLSLIHI